MVPGGLSRPGRIPPAQDDHPGEGAGRGGLLAQGAGGHVLDLGGGHGLTSDCWRTRFGLRGRYRAEIYADDLEGTTRQLLRQTEEVSAQDVLKAQLESAGGYMVRLTRLPGK